VTFYDFHYNFCTTLHIHQEKSNSFTNQDSNGNLLECINYKKNMLFTSSMQNLFQTEIAIENCRHHRGFS